MTALPPALPGEEWRPVVGFEDAYEVSDTGLVRSRRTGKELRQACLTRGGYRMVSLCDARNGVRRRDRRVHQLVLEAFVGPRPEGMLTRHLDGDGSNNRLTNLRYGTSEENNRDIVRHGRHRKVNATTCKQGHPWDDENTLYRGGNGRDVGTRRCRACKREVERRADAAKVAA